MGKQYFNRDVYFRHLDTGSLFRNGTKVTPTAAELNKINGLTADTSELNTLDGITASTSELNELDLDTVGATKKYKVISIDNSDFGDSSEIDTGESIPEDSIVKNVWLYVDTAEDSGTLDIGTLSSGSGDADGYLVGVDATTEGPVQGTVDMTDVDGASTTLGALLVETDTTNDTAVRKSHLFGTDNVSATASGEFTTFEGRIVLEYVEVASA